MQQITVTPNYPNQTINFVVNNQNFTLNLYWRGTQGQPEAEQEYLDTYAPAQYYADIFLGSSLIIAGTPVVDRTPINLYPSNMIGYIMSVDSTGTNNPNLINLGVTVFIYYLDNLTQLSTLAVV